ncbi:MAG TPA: carboxypeptidase-like regulatory domain-containing protein [Bacteroidales bacterium]|nr:carboxypeptidase-like regulatory domain-containing protein [Bacteroidales bacterium]
MRFYLFFVAFIFAFNISAQPIFNGKVVDAETKEPLAFVNIVYGKHQGVTSNIDGIFSFPVTSDSINVKISFIGYKQYLLTVNRSDTKHFKIIYLHPEPFQLNSVTILPGKNPAERIINQVIKNRKVLDPEQHLKSFAYKSYNKMYFTAKTRHNKSLAKDSIPIALDSTLYTNLPDSSQIKKNDTAATNKMERFLQKRHFLMMETISQRYYKAPQKDFEKIIASKVSGFTMPTFVILATQLQSFSFYKTQLNLLDKHYLSPISKTVPKTIYSY